MSAYQGGDFSSRPAFATRWSVAIAVRDAVAVLATARGLFIFVLKKVILIVRLNSNLPVQDGAATLTGPPRLLYSCACFLSRVTVLSACSYWGLITSSGGEEQNIGQVSVRLPRRYGYKSNNTH